MFTSPWAPLLRHHQSPGHGFQKPGKWASLQPSDHWHHYPPEASGVLEKHFPCYKNSTQMASRSQQHLEICGRRVGFLTDSGTCHLSIKMEYYTPTSAPGLVLRQTHKSHLSSSKLQCWQRTHHQGQRPGRKKEGREIFPPSLLLPSAK